MAGARSVDVVVDRIAVAESIAKSRECSGLRGVIAVGTAGKVEVGRKQACHVRNYSIPDPLLANIAAIHPAAQMTTR